MLNSSFWSGRVVLVTGHNGFKGSWLCFWLKQLGAIVHGISLPTPTEPSLSSQLNINSLIDGSYFQDICDAGSLFSIISFIQPQVVFHLAAQPIVRLSYEDPLNTWQTNVQGSLNLLEALKPLTHRCAVVMVTTDKVYYNREWFYGYREDDKLGGHDPYSASKAAAELAVASWRSSFCGSGTHQTQYLSIATARAGNVIGGGDWTADRIMPDLIRSLTSNEVIKVRSPNANRPWQHVLEPLSGYLLLAERLFLESNLHGSISSNLFSTAFNFGPKVESNRSVQELVEHSLSIWPGGWKDTSTIDSVHEAQRLHLQIDKAYHQLGWEPRWSFETTIERTVVWYRDVHNGIDPSHCCQSDLDAYIALLA